jgi:hypothetical protein
MHEMRAQHDRRGVVVGGGVVQAVDQNEDSKEESGRFFEKKLRKKLLRVWATGVENTSVSGANVFWFFFSKKNHLLPFTEPAPTLPRHPTDAPPAAA